MMCPYSIPEAITLWSKASNFHHGNDPESGRVISQKRVELLEIR
jgi:hypothetical protein